MESKAAFFVAHMIYGGVWDVWVESMSCVKHGFVCNIKEHTDEDRHLFFFSCMYSFVNV